MSVPDREADEKGADVDAYWVTGASEMIRGCDTPPFYNTRVRPRMKRVEDSSLRIPGQHLISALAAAVATAPLVPRW
jgi:hypothetical protein